MCCSSPKLTDITADMNSRGRSEYIWQKLPRPSKDIRLLTLYPGDWDDEIQYSLEVVPLFNAPPYQALSYTWGDPSIRVPIFVHDSDSPFNPTYETPVTCNLTSALRDLRSSTSEMRLWIDALCINQTDPVERTQQVNSMGMIYRKASFVWIWLGTGNKKIDLAVKLFTNMGSASDHNSANAIGGFNEAEWAALAEFFSRSWWSRIWVVQEVMYAREAQLVCGKHRIPWGHIQKATETYIWRKHNHESLLGSRFSDLCADFQELNKYKRKYEEDPNRDLMDGRGTKPRDTMWRQPLQTLLWAFRYRQASEAKDKIYALIDLAKKPVPLQPDYSKSTVDVYCELAKSFMRQSGDKNPLDIIGVTHNIYTPRIRDLPSWVPDWSAWEDTVCLGFVSHLQGGQSRYHANDDITRCGFWEYPEPLRGFIKQRVASVPDSKEALEVLTIKGVLIGTLSMVGPNFNTADSPRNFFNNQNTVSGLSHPDVDSEGISSRPPPQFQPRSSQPQWELTLNQWIPPDHDSGIHSATGETRQKAFWQTILASSPTPIGTEHQERFLAWSRSLDSLQYTDEMASASTEILPRSLGDSLRGWRFGTTCKGYYGLVPNLAQEGDIICVPFGSSTPFVLRRGGKCIDASDQRDLEGRQYHLIGRCYVHGLMNGEAMETAHELFERAKVVGEERGIEAAKTFIDDGIQEFILV